MGLQRTLKSAVALNGVGVHSGKSVRMVLKPAPVRHGIQFLRSDLEGSPRIPASYKNVVNTQLATTLGIGRVTISTVEHVLAVLQGLDIDNALVEVDGPEVPIMDGSSAPFYEAINRVGVEIQHHLRPYLALRKKVELKLAEKWAVAEPASRLEIFGSIEWDHPSIGYQEFHYKQGKTDFEDIAGARTFGFLRDVEALKKKGLARGGSLDNAVVLDHALVLNPEGLRCPDEFVRHKVLDALGDLKLAGIAIHAFIRVHRGGHDLHYQLLNEIFRDPNHYEIVDGRSTHEELMVGASLNPILAQSLAIG